MAEIAKVSYTHDAMIDLIVDNPRLSQNELAAHFGYSPSWISQVVNSDAFRERLAERREDVVDPVLRMSLEERIRGVTSVAIDVLLDKLKATENPNIAIRVLEHGTRALGYGAQKQQQVVVQNYVAVVPPKSLDSAAWSEAHAPLVIEARERLIERRVAPNQSGAFAARSPTATSGSPDGE